MNPDNSVLFSAELYWSVVYAMIVLAVVVFVALQWIEAPYGIAFSRKWGPSIHNKAGWVVMELPALVVMLLIVSIPDADRNAATMVMAGLFVCHYVQRTLIFPLLMRGRSRMPWAIVLMGAAFNSINAYLIGGWLMYLGPQTGQYTSAWFATPQFIVGAVVFVIGMGINLHSDHVIRHLRRPGETGHKIPHGGMYRYVASANYLGELIEWTGFALLTWSMAGVVFVLWTAANLVPRAAKIHARYCAEFGDEYRRLHRRRIFPFIY